jgi:HTH-type transcriptional regulator/antitoxin HigA
VSLFFYYKIKFVGENMDNTKYSQLLAESAPQVIETEEEYERLLKIAERLVFKNDLTPEERALSKLVVFLVEDYETKNYPMDDESTPQAILKHIMDSSGNSQADLARITGSSSGVISEILSGKRDISKKQAKALSAHFKVDPSLFI